MDELLATLTKELVVDFGNHEGYEPSIGKDAPQGSGVEFLPAKDWKGRVPMDSSGTDDGCILDNTVQRFYVYVPTWGTWVDGGVHASLVFS